MLDDGARLLLTPTMPAVAREHRVALEVDQFVGGLPGRGHLALDRTQVLVQIAVREESTWKRGWRSKSGTTPRGCRSS